MHEDLRWNICNRDKSGKKKTKSSVHKEWEEAFDRLRNKETKKTSLGCRFCKWAL